MSRVWLLRVSVAGSLIVVAVLAACGSGSPEASSSAQRSDVVTVVVATDLAFQPQEISVPEDQRVTVRLQNKGKVLHDWTVERIAVTGAETRGSGDHAMGHGGGSSGSALHVAADAGRTADATFIPTEAGEYIFYCTVAGHREAGMEGRLIVR